MIPTNDPGRKTFFWYRVYCAVLAVIYLALVAFGIFLLVAQPETREYDRDQIYLMGIVYIALGAIFFIASSVALLLPAKPFNWIVGIVMIALGLTSCCFLPVCIPLLIYWLKPETKAFFGRN